MFLQLGDEQVEIKTTLGVAMKIEKASKHTLLDVFSEAAKADIESLIKTLSFGTDDENLKEKILEHMDYSDLQTAAQEMVAKLMYSGTDEEIEEKFNKQGLPEEAKNAMRGILGMAIPETPEASTGNK